MLWAAQTAWCEQRYWILLEDGTQRTGEQLDSWLGGEGAIKLDGKPVGDKNNPLRIVRDTSLISENPGPHIRLTNGDVLPGRLEQLAPASMDAATEHFIVRPALDAHNAVANRQIVRVREHCVAQIVLEGAGQTRYRPGWISFRDGREITARSIRFDGDAIRGLADDDLFTASLREVREIHLPDRNLIEGVLDDAVYAEGDVSGRIVRVRLAAGAQFTFPGDMIATEFRLKDATRRGRLQGDIELRAIRPVWALDTVLLDRREVVLASYRRNDEVPLSLLPVVRVQEAHGLHAWPWRRNRSVGGELLRSGNLAADLGIGAHAASEVVFQLPEAALELSGYVGIDTAVGKGGCAKAQVHRDQVGEKPIWESGFLIGGQQPVSLGRIHVGGAKQLVLVADVAHQGRPPGADPLDIRDEVDWLLPTVRVDLAKIPQTERDLGFWIPALAGWEPSPETARHLQLQPAWSSSEGEWRMATLLADAAWPDPNDAKALRNDAPIMEFRRTLKVSLVNARLPVAAGRNDGNRGSHVVTVEVDGEELGSTMNGPIKTTASSLRQRFDSRHWILGDFASREVTVSIVATPHRTVRQPAPLIVWEMATPRPLIEGLPPSGRPLAPDVPITALKPIKIKSEHDVKLDIQRGKLVDGQPLCVCGYPLDEGFGAPTGSEITYALDPSWGRFVAVIGLADGWQGAGPYQILLDGEPHWSNSPSKAFGRNDPGQQIDVVIPPGHKTITLVIGGRESQGAWAHAGFVRE